MKIIKNLVFVFGIIKLRLEMIIWFVVFVGEGFVLCVLRSVLKIFDLLLIVENGRYYI